MNITSVKYISPVEGESESSSLNATIDGIEMFVPMDVYNRQYAAILKWVEEGNTIQDADKEVLTWDRHQSYKKSNINRYRLDYDNWSYCRSGSMGCI